jgi:hypothetical protein
MAVCLQSLRSPVPTLRVTGFFFKCRHHKMSSGVKSADLGGMDDQYTISTSYKNAAVFHLESNKDCQ